MLSRKLFCVADPTHADFGWAAESRFLHIRKYDACGNTTSNWTFPVADTATGEMTCAICGSPAYMALPPTAAGTASVVSCDFLGHCQSGPADANLARLDALCSRLADIPFPVERARIASAVAALIRATADDPAAVAILERHKIKDVYAAG
ncbi:hypothetical protein DVDV_2664 [Desulfovibrio sp. DV]|uniref:hypothetical protein n=1 Tax=Desulfovibrio sp. DV TaxID=1844708 RepID=UPI00094B99E6|nr:hypothetical protein [Desulfovibrio sp. DV]OLN26481.1 hypothetical protein DVDV_2664 [Desulfovibrio sp. DV]